METGINRPQKHQGSGAPLTGAQMGDANPPSGERMNEPVQQAQSASPAEQVGGADPRKNLKPDAQTKIDIQHLNFFYGSKQALTDVSLPIREHQVTALIGPSGCGKTTFLRTLNRMNDLIPNTRTEGEALLDGENIYARTVDVVMLRQRVGMVFQRPNPFPKSIFENVAYGLHVQGRSKKDIGEMVEKSLRDAALWD